MSVEKRIDNVIDETNRNPLVFHREADIRAMLFTELKKEYKNLYETGLGYKTGAVHCEYFGGHGSRVDVVVFKKNDIKNIKKITFEKSRSGEHVKLDAAIEIKTEHGWYGKERERLIDNDIKKLLTLQKKNPGIKLFFLYIVRWPTTKKQIDIMKIVKYIKSECKQHKIVFKTNNESNYFLQNTRY